MRLLCFDEEDAPNCARCGRLVGCVMIKKENDPVLCVHCRVHDIITETEQ